MDSKNEQLICGVTVHDLEVMRKKAYRIHEYCRSKRDCCECSLFKYCDNYFHVRDNSVMIMPWKK